MCEKGVTVDCFVSTSAESMYWQYASRMKGRESKRV